MDENHVRILVFNKIVFILCLQKMLKSTGDSSTACSTLITELHNPHINTDYCNGRNLHIASLKYGIIHISDYARRVLKHSGDSN